MRLAAEVDVADADPGRPQKRVEMPEGLGRDVLEDEDPAHMG